ncbi:hypothetical protein R1flu_027956 [Riccia fluitans]|uniref:Uncharacterized protein n=1 Tax=Riccia fluitans TaxID=41844 RepID=A0ABD1XKA5_9MARC
MGHGGEQEFCWREGAARRLAIKTVADFQPREGANIDIKELKRETSLRVTWKERNALVFDGKRGEMPYGAMLAKTESEAKGLWRQGCRRDE